jgi:hypothetical protein
MTQVKAKHLNELKVLIKGAISDLTEQRDEILGYFKIHNMKLNAFLCLLDKFGFELPSDEEVNAWVDSKMPNESQSTVARSFEKIGNLADKIVSSQSATNNFVAKLEELYRKLGLIK